MSLSRETKQKLWRLFQWLPEETLDSLEKALDGLDDLVAQNERYEKMLYDLLENGDETVREHVRKAFQRPEE